MSRIARLAAPTSHVMRLTPWFLPPGWFATEVPELLNPCKNSHPFPFRFVLGAPAVGTRRVHILCDAAPDE